MAEEWIQKEPKPAAFHCRAMALFALGRYQQAAGALATLEQQLQNDNPVLWGNVVRQQARSWVLAGDNAKAIIALSSGIARVGDEALAQPLLARLCAELLLDRSALYLDGGRDLFALQDLDQALSLSPENPQLLLARAQLFASQNEVELARRDVQALEALYPNYPGAGALLESLR